MLKKYGIKRSGFFGSFARGQATAKSDIDLLVQMKPDSSLLDLLELKSELEKKVKRNFDLVTYQGLSARLAKQVKSDEVRVL